MKSVRYKQIATTDWDIDSGYDIGTVVEYDGHAYVSVKVVPVGVNIGMTDYWKPITTDEDIADLQEALDAIGTDVNTIQSQLVVTVGEDDVPFQFAYDTTNEVYGFMVGEVFHPFGGEVIGE